MYLIKDYLAFLIDKWYYIYSGGDRIYKELRTFMKSEFGTEGIPSDQSLKKKQPALAHTFEQYDTVVALLPWEEVKDIDASISEAFFNRESHRQFTDENLSLKELSYLLYATQGVKEIVGDNYCTVRTVPSAGARHPFETYLVVHHVDDVEAGVYGYNAMEHQLHLIEEGDMVDRIIEASLGQRFAGRCSVTFVWTCVAYRGEWRYTDKAHKAMLLDAGHLCQNLYIACETMNAGTCAIAAYDQAKADSLLKVDGEEEFTIYLSPVGKVKK